MVFEVEWKGKSFHFRFIFTGTKGDWPFLRSAYSLECGFTSTQKCHRCEIRELWLECVQIVSFWTRWSPIFFASSLNEHPFSPSPVFLQGMVGRERPFEDLARRFDQHSSFQGGWAESSPRVVSGWCYKVYTDRSGAYMGDRWCRKRLSGKLHYPIGSCKIILVAGPPHIACRTLMPVFLAYCNAYKKTTSITEFGFSTFKLPQNSLLGFVNIFFPQLEGTHYKKYLTFSPIFGLDPSCPPKGWMGFLMDLEKAMMLQQWVLG